MPGSYYDRRTTYLDGRSTFKTAEDMENEFQVAGMLEDAWGCRLHPYSDYSPIDWWAERSGIIVGWVELKSRPHPEGKYDGIYLNHRKWLALHLAQMSGPPSIFVVKHIDSVRWIRLNDIDPTRITIGGCKSIVKSSNDIEPVIKIPLDKMTPLKGFPG